MKRFSRITALLLAAVFLLSACSGDVPETVSFSQEETDAQPATMPHIDPLPAQTDSGETAEPETTVSAETGGEETSAAPETSAAETSGTPDSGKYVALTFDDGPDMRYTSSTSRILDTLEKYGAHATFFVQAVQLTSDVTADEETGESFATRNKRILKRAADMGMEIGTHTFDHPQLTAIPMEEVRSQISRSCELIESVTGKEVKICRPPYGDVNEEILNEFDMPFIIWDVDSLDWDHKDPDKAYEIVMNEVENGSIILMHDIYNTTADAAEMIVPALIERGYTVCSVSELFEHLGKPLEGHHKYNSAR